MHGEANPLAFVLLSDVMLVLGCIVSKAIIVLSAIKQMLTKLLLDLDTGESITGGALPRPIKFILEEFPSEALHTPSQAET